MKFLLVLCYVVLLFSFTNGSCKRSIQEMDQRADNTTNHYERSDQQVYSYPASNARPASGSNALKFMAFNQQSGFVASCQSNVNAQTQFIASQNVDYLASQEIVQGVSSRCNCNMPQMIAAAGMTSRFGKAIPYGTGLYGINVASAQNVLETRMQYLNYGGVEQRLVIAVRTQPAALRGRNLWFASVHVDFFNTAARYSQIDQLINIMRGIMTADPSAVVVIGGDFNGGPWDQGYTMMKNAGYTNAWERFTGSINGGNTKSGNRFDHIWFKAPSGVTISVTSCIVHEVALSDHYPVSAVLAFSVSGSSTSSTTGYVPPPPVAPTTRPGSSTVCAGPIFENQPVTIRCPLASQTMRSVDFANYGVNSGTCGSFQKGNCVGGSSTAVVVDKCIGKNSCTFPVANNVFGDPCPRTGKDFRVQVQCA